MNDGNRWRDSCCSCGQAELRLVRETPESPKTSSRMHFTSVPLSRQRSHLYLADTISGSRRLCVSVLGLPEHKRTPKTQHYLARNWQGFATIKCMCEAIPLALTRAHPVISPSLDAHGKISEQCVLLEPMRTFDIGNTPSSTLPLKQWHTLQEIVS